MSKKRHYLTASVALLTVTTPLFLQATQNNPTIESTFKSLQSEPGYTINFTDVPVLEVVKFLSKIGNLNFVYSEADLQFSITMTSEGEASLPNVLSSFFEVLKINGLFITEDGNNILIHKNDALSSLAPVYADTTPIGKSLPGVLTRVYDLKNANPQAASVIIAELLSGSGIVANLIGSRKVVVTDTIGSIEKVSDLIAALESPTSTLKLKTFKVATESGALVSLLRQLLTPISEGNPLIITGDPESAHIFILSTPFLLSQAADFIQMIDAPGVLLNAENIFIYKIEYQPYAALKQSLIDISQGLSLGTEDQGDLVHTIKQMKYIAQTNSIAFIGSRKSIEQIKHLLANLDSQVSSTYLKLDRSDFYIYKIEHAHEDVIESSIENILDTLKKSSSPDTGLITALESMKYISETHSLVFVGNEAALNRIKQILPTIDIATEKKPLKNLPLSNEYFVYKPKTHDAEALLDSVEELGESLHASGLADQELLKTLESGKFVKSTNTIVFTGDAASIAKVKQIVEMVDVPKTGMPASSEFYVYKPQNKSGEKLLDELRELAKNFRGAGLENKELLSTLSNARYVSSTNSLIFTGTSSSMDEIKSILPTIDLPASSDTNVYVYKIQHATKSTIEDGLDKIAENLPSNDPLKETIETMSYLPSANSLVFKGKEDSLSRVKNLLGVIDTQAASKDYSFALIKLHNASGQAVMKDIRQMVENLKESGAGSERLIQTLDSAHFVESTNSVYISGAKEAVSEAQSIISGFDISQKKGVKDQFLLYKLKNASGPAIIDNVKEMISHLKRSGVDDPQLIESLSSAQYVQSSNSIYVTGTPDVLAQVQNILENFDVPQANAGQTYFIYKLKNADGPIIIEELRKMESNISSSGIENKNLLRSLSSARFISATNSIYFTGSSQTIEEVKSIIQSFDIPLKESPKNSSFYIYKPEYGTPKFVRENLVSIAEELRDAGLADTSLIETIRNVRIVDSTQSLLFTGTPENIAEIKTLVAEVDNPSHKIASDGKISFVVYKIKYAAPDRLIANLKSIAGDLKGARAGDQELIQTLDTVRYVQETNSLVFTGTNESLEKALNLVSKFDTKEYELAVPQITPENYLVYKPQNLSGEELIQIVKDFQQNLVASGVKDTELFTTINNIKWMPRTSSILIAGPDKATREVEALLREFDIPGEGGNLRANIETINDLSFLIYKLQYHQGNEIESALRSIAQDLAIGPNKEKNQSLIDAINSIQWIQVTNSLIGTGEGNTLGKLKDLLKNIDIPLRQVFIEVLVVDTTVTDFTEFGLRWGTQGVIKERLAIGGSSIPTAPPSGTDPFSSFTTGLSGITATNTPKGQSIPFVNGATDLGVIGDIILHKGKTYFSLGSLINALQTDAESTVVLNQKLITQDNQQSSVFVGNNIPYTGSVVTTTQNAGSQTNANLEYRDIGVNLVITPTVGDGDMVTLSIDQQITEEENTDDDTTSSSTVVGIRTSKTATQTRVTMPTDSFLAISGMMRNQTVYTKTGVPCLGGIPVLGLAFSQNDRQKVAHNIIIFIRPHIINTFDEYKNITQRQEDLYRSQAPVEDFDAAIELVKTPDDD